MDNEGGLASRALGTSPDFVQAGIKAIDCDIHNEVPTLQTLFPHMSDFWCDYCSHSGFRGPDANDYPRAAPLTTHPDAKSPWDIDLAHIRERLLDGWNLEYGILNCAYRVQSVHNPDLAAAIAQAINDWQIEHWLDPEPRLRASLVIPSQIPELAAREIERVGEHLGFVQAILPVRSRIPYGNRIHHPIYEAAVRHNLAIGIHYGGAPGNQPSPTGWPSTYLEEYSGMTQVFQAQVISLVAECVFDQFPELRIVLIESGFTWLPAVMWRIDKEWRGLRNNTPWLKRPPSEYMRNHIRFTLQPIDAPPTRKQLLQIIGQLESDEMLMFSTDYPHWQFDTPNDALPPELPGALARKILSENARAFYQL